MTDFTGISGGTPAYHSRRPAGPGNAVEPEGATLTVPRYEGYSSAISRGDAGSYTLVFDRFESSGAMRQTFASSSPDGVTWSQPGKLHSGFATAPCLCAPPGGQLECYLMKQGSKPGSFVLGRTVKSGAGSWAPVTTASVASETILSPWVIPLSKNDRLMVFQSANKVFCTCSGDAGKSWDTPAALAEGLQPRVIKYKNRYILAFQKYAGKHIELYSATSIDGRKWNTPRKITSLGNTHDPHLSVDNRGQLNIAAVTTFNDTRPYQVIRLTSRDGITWSQPEQLDPSSSFSYQPRLINDGQKAVLLCSRSASGQGNFKLHSKEIQ